MNMTKVNINGRRGIKIDFDARRSMILWDDVLAGVCPRGEFRLIEHNKAKPLVGQVKEILDHCGNSTRVPRLVQE